MSSPRHEARVEPIPSVKDLASSEPALRRQCLTAILAHLTARSANNPFTATQCLQFWRGFSVALYMHDSKNAVSVQNLIKTLASTMTTLYEKDIELQAQRRSDDVDAEEGEAADGKAEQWPWLSTWTTAFWETLCREWSGIDQWRMNKYLLLVRFGIKETFSIISSHIDDSAHSKSTSSEESSSANTATGVDSLLSSQFHIIRSFPLSPRERKVPDGLRLHVLDIWLDELDNISSDAEDQGQSYDDLKTQLMQPIRDLAKDAMTKSVRMKAKECVKAYDAATGGSET